MAAQRCYPEIPIGHTRMSLGVPIFWLACYTPGFLICCSHILTTGALHDRYPRSNQTGQLSDSANPTILSLADYSCIGRYLADYSCIGRYLVFTYIETGPCSQTNYRHAVSRIELNAGLYFHGCVVPLSWLQLER